MAVYVDTGGTLAADTRAELDTVARAVGVPRKHRQASGTPLEHYVLTTPQADAAIRAGARILSIAELAHAVTMRVQARNVRHRR